LSPIMQIVYECVGDGDPFVLLHGFSDTRETWREAGYVERLIQRGRRSILIDCRGHGESGKPHDPNAYSGGKMAADVAAVLDALGIATTDVMGHSLGGAMAMAFAVQFPARIGALVVIGAHPFAQDMSVYRAAVTDNLEPWLAMVESQARELSAATRRRLLTNDVRALRACVARDRQDRSAAVMRSAAPLLAIAGALDPLKPSIQRFAMRRGAHYLELPDRNHITALQAVDEVIAGLDVFFAHASAT
jgi:pimeloyl-ACP methyl ester carboxylesterase